jgi:hypothetical protein
MSDRSWFYAAEGQQRGPYPEAQLRELIATGTVSADTLVWTDGMADWQKAGQIPGLLSGGSGPPAIPHAGRPLAMGGVATGQSLSADFGVWELFWRSLAVGIGSLFVIPVPWLLTMYCRWFVSRLQVPQRPNLGFTGRPMELWWFWPVIVVSIAVSFTEYEYLSLLILPVQLLLYWFLLKWAVARITSDGRQVPISFEGSPWAWIGWQLLLCLSFVTVIGWAWVTAAWLRWIGRNIAGTRRDVVFNGSGLEILWRSLVFAITAIFIIPIPWVMAWYYRWLVSQFALVARAV